MKGPIERSECAAVSRGTSQARRVWSLSVIPSHIRQPARVLSSAMGAPERNITRNTLAANVLTAICVDKRCQHAR